MKSFIKSTGKRRLIYIGGYGRSGSTLLEIVLSKVMAGVGEVVNFPRYILQSQMRCSCGKDLNDCPLWSKVLEKYSSPNRVYDMSRLQRLYSSEETWTGLLRMFLKKKQLNRYREYRSAVCAFYSSVFSAIDSPNIVESSKTARGTRARPALLKKICGVEVKLIHLTRDPRGVYHSICKGSNKLIEAGKDPKIAFASLRAPLGWTLANLACYLNGIILGRRNYLRIRYEDLVLRPEMVLEKIGGFLSIDMIPVINVIRNSGYFHSGHLLAANRMARKGDVKIRPDLSWQRILPVPKHVAIWLAVWPLAMLYGYPPFIKQNN